MKEHDAVTAPAELNPNCARELLWFHLVIVLTTQSEIQIIRKSIRIVHQGYLYFITMKKAKQRVKIPVLTTQQTEDDL